MPTITNGPFEAPKLFISDCFFALVGVLTNKTPPSQDTTRARPPRYAFAVGEDTNSGRKKILNSALLHRTSSFNKPSEPRFGGIYGLGDFGF